MTLPDAHTLPDWLASREAAVPHLRPGCAKRVDWPTGRTGRAAVSVVYIHGFSATGREVSPMPERVAAELEAPLFATRLTGHGQDGAAMGRATLAEWRADVTEALEIGRALGDRTIVMGCSTGCTLLSLALADAADKAGCVAGAVMISPNYGLRSWLVQGILDAPLAARWAPVVTGRMRGFPAQSADHAAYWTLRYPTQALFPMADALRAARRIDHGRIVPPALFAWSDRDRVIDPVRAARVAQTWGGGAEVVTLQMTAQDDPNCHLVAGDVFSPGQTEPLVARIVAWARARLG